MYMGRQTTPLGALDRRIPRNPKYDKVRGELDTGNTASKMRIMTTKEVIRKQNEVFHRMTPKELDEWMEMDQLGEDECHEEREEVQAAQRNGPMVDYDKDRDLVLERAKMQQKNDESHRLLLLDLREPADFHLCHVRGAVSYPVGNIKMDKFTTSMHRFKNRSGKYIVVYDEDERVAGECATLLIQKGFENVRVLSGGLRLLGNRHPRLLSSPLPESLVEQQVTSPVEAAQARRERRERRRQEAGSIQGSPRALLTDGSSLLGGTAASTFSYSTQRTTFSRAPRWKEETSKHRQITARMGHPIL